MKESLTKIFEWEMENMILSHGELIVGKNIEEVLKEAWFSFYLFFP